MRCQPSGMLLDRFRGRTLPHYPIEVKATARPRPANAAHLRKFGAEYGKNARAGLLLHTGTMME